MADSRYNRMNNQAPAQTQLEASNPPVGRSAFDFSCIHSGNTMYGLVAPVDCFDFVPNEDIDIDISALVELRNPLLRNILNGSRVYFHCYINYLVDLWEGAKNFLDAGRSGRISLKRPNLIYKVEKVDVPGDDYIITEVNSCTPMSLLNFLGMPAQALQDYDDVTRFPPLRSFSPAFVLADNTETIADIVGLSKAPDFFPADCAFAYQRNWRDYYANENLLQNNKMWFPDNEDHFILSYSCENAIAVNYEHETLDDGTSSLAINQANNLLGLDDVYGNEMPASQADLIAFWKKTHDCNNPRTIAESWSKTLAPNLAGIKFRQFKGDRFTTALPFPDLIRGDIPVLADTGDYSTLSARLTSGLSGNVYYGNVKADYGYVEPDTDDTVLPYTKGRFLTVDLTSASFPSGESSGLSASFKLGSAITMNDIRALETMTVFKERMARTSGEYNDMIEAQYGYNPHHHIRKGEYVGGFYQDFAFSSVVQTSESGSTPLGTKAGQGVSNGQGRIGHVHTRDFGWLQIYMSIVPDVMYTQGVPRMFSKDTQEKMYFPIFNNLAPQAIQNKELFVTGNPAVDNDVFAYEDRYAEYKSRPNRVSGFMSLSPSVARFDSAKIMARRFTSTPSLNSQFVTLVPENVDMNVFAVNNEPPFDFQVGIRVRRVFPGPYTAIPGSLSSGLHA